MRCVASVDERRNDLQQRRHWWGRSVGTPREHLCALDADLLAGDETDLHPAAETARVDSSGVNSAWNDGIEDNEQHSDDDDDGKEQREAEEDTATTYGFQMRRFLRRTNALSISLRSRRSVRRSLLSIVATMTFLKKIQQLHNEVESLLA